MTSHNLYDKLKIKNKVSVLNRKILNCHLKGFHLRIFEFLKYCPSQIVLEFSQFLAFFSKLSFCILNPYAFARFCYNSAKWRHVIIPTFIPNFIFQTISNHSRPFSKYSRSKIEKLPDIVGYRTLESVFKHLLVALHSLHKLNKSIKLYFSNLLIYLQKIFIKLSASIISSPFPALFLISRC